jgi:2-succinyl-6-hydroxy-2,4-cyclohexadiene-1-carboxylate synthase
MTRSSGDRSPTYLVHGFTQTPESWGPVTEALGATAVDAPANTLWDAAGALARHGAGTWIGYSMGGRMALHLALSHPSVVERLVLVSATAGIDDPAAREARIASDEALAARAERIGAEAFVAEWVAQPMFAGLPPLPRTDDLPVMVAHLRQSGAGAQQSLWHRLGELSMPVLVVTGGRDQKFGELGDRLTTAIQHAEHVVVEGAGHAVPFERPDEFVDVVRRWLAH